MKSCQNISNTLTPQCFNAQLPWCEIWCHQNNHSKRCSQHWRKFCWNINHHALTCVSFIVMKYIFTNTSKVHKITYNYIKSSEIHFSKLWPKIQVIVTLLHSIKQVWSKSDNKKWSKLYKMWITLLWSRSYRLFKVYFKSAKKGSHDLLHKESANNKYRSTHTLINQNTSQFELLLLHQKLSS